jgi:hypothetical protein
MKRIALISSIVVVIATIAAGCSIFGKKTEEATPAGEIQATSGTPREISGQEALQLYGVATEDPALVKPTSTPLYFFPARAWVLPNEIPYDPDETITILPMFTRPSLNDGGTWLGDLQAGSQVVLQGVNAERTACLVEGLALQGWSTMGWVACNRLRFDED